MFIWSPKITDKRCWRSLRICILGYSILLSDKQLSKTVLKLPWQVRFDTVCRFAIFRRFPLSLRTACTPSFIHCITFHLCFFEIPCSMFIQLFCGLLLCFSRYTHTANLASTETKTVASNRNGDMYM